MFLREGTCDQVFIFTYVLFLIEEGTRQTAEDIGYPLVAVCVGAASAGNIYVESIINPKT